MKNELLLYTATESIGFFFFAVGIFIFLGLFFYKKIFPKEEEKEKYSLRVDFFGSSLMVLLLTVCFFFFIVFFCNKCGEP